MAGILLGRTITTSPRRKPLWARRVRGRRSRAWETSRPHPRSTREQLTVGAAGRVRVCELSGALVHQALIVTAETVHLSDKRRTKTTAYRHSGYAGGLKSLRYDELMEKNPAKAVEKAVKGMLPKNTLGRQMLSKLKV